ncbi:hypothetical protein Tco_0182754, partial [Tanacetum coccineum]
MPEDTVDHMDIENAQDEGRTREVVDEDKEIEENALSTEEVLSTDFGKVSTDKQNKGTDEQDKGTEEQNEGTKEQNEGTKEQNEGTEEIFEGTKEHIEGTKEQVESTDRHKKGIEEEITPQATQTSTQTPTSMIFGDDEIIATSQRSLLTLKHLPKIDPKDKGKKKIEEEDESERVRHLKFKQIESDEEMTRKIQEEWEAEEVRNKIAEEEATNEAL